MPNSLLTRISLGRLKVAWVSAVAIIILLVTLSRSLTWYALMQEEHERAVASLVNTQELRTQRLYRDVILLQNPSDCHCVDYPAVTREVVRDEAVWARIQKGIYSGDAALGVFPTDFSAQALLLLDKEKPDFLTMDGALLRIIAAEHRGATPDQVRPDVGYFFLKEPAYIQAVVTAYSDLSLQADVQVGSVQMIEWVIFGLTLAVIAYEALFIVRPALFTLHGQLRLMVEKLHLPPEEEADKKHTQGKHGE